MEVFSEIYLEGETRMDFVEKIKNFFRQSKKEKKDEDTSLLTKQLIQEFVFFQLTSNELEFIKKIFEEKIAKQVNRLKETESTIYLILSPHFLQKMLTSDEESSNIADSPLLINHHYQVLKELKNIHFDLDVAEEKRIEKLYHRLMTKKLWLHIEELPNLLEIAKLVNEGLKNHRYDKIIESIVGVNKSYLELPKSYRELLQEKNEEKLITALEALSKKIESELIYFKAWNSRSELKNDYSVRSIDKHFTPLMKDYLFFTLAKTSLLDLKEKQGVADQNIFQIIEYLDRIDQEFQALKMEDWLAPPSPQTSWKHRLFRMLNKKNQQIRISFEDE